MGKQLIVFQSTIPEFNFWVSDISESLLSLTAAEALMDKWNLWAPLEEGYLKECVVDNIYDTLLYLDSGSIMLPGAAVKFWKFSELDEVKPS